MSNHNLVERMENSGNDSTQMRCKWYDVCEEKNCDGTGKIRKKRHMPQDGTSRYSNIKCYSFKIF